MSNELTFAESLIPLNILKPSQNLGQKNHLAKKNHLDSFQVIVNGAITFQ